MTIRLRTLFLGLLLALVLAGGVAALLVWRGVYDISATDQHTAPVFKVLDYAMRRSVLWRTENIVPPPDLADTRRVRAGAAHYREHCVQCHGAPGVAPDPLAFGLTPAPANLLAAGRTWQPGEIFWVVKEGIKMTGMPAWVYRLSDEEVWDVVAFVRAMPLLAPRDYAQLASTLPAPGSAAPSRVAPARRGDVAAGRLATERYLCVTCHVIPGFVSASHHVGPPLDGMGKRSFIAGVLPNTPDNMVRFLLQPQQVDPLTAMPALGMSQQDARDIAAFLATLDKVKAK
ncbi:c-type cytochrome [Ramlibacter henchirensis]|uniref:C-type cytochrome n=1 Tax=Ramlibacter henchirensis TaxID=204072 RepID=A0A4Z0C9R4_9BURK|nr:c-type cytochrome [Ramlibacter henchirensis]TFZ07148.1 c-type cytochrome [Ramlibacter henchirensis]